VWYLKVAWSHSHADEPIELYSEVGDDGYETRKVQLFRDGRLEWANAETETDLTGLSECPVGSIEEIDSTPELSASTISKEEFEDIWRQAGGPTGE